MAATDVKNNIVKPFDTIFLIVFGFILTEHIKNLVQLFIDNKDNVGNNKDNGLIYLGIAIFLLLFLSIIETVLDYSASNAMIKSSKVVPNLLRHLIWFVQFFPIYYIVDVLVDKHLTDEIKCKQISFSMSVIYCVYLLINVIKFYRSEKQDRNDYWKNIVFYFIIALFFYSNGQFFISWETSPAIFLSISFGIVMILYIFYWKKYYKERLFEVSVTPQTQEADVEKLVTALAPEISKLVKLVIAEKILAIAQAVVKETKKE